MCVRTIVDTNLLAEVTGRDPSGSFGSLRRWIVRGDGRILYTDEAGFRQEMDRAGESWRQLLFRYRQNDRMELADASEVEDAKQKLASISRKSGENDLPLLALAAAAEVEVLCTDDQALKADFKSTEVLQPLPRRARAVYPLPPRQNRDRPASENMSQAQRRFLNNRRCRDRC